MLKKNRLSSIFDDFANRFELQHKFDQDVQNVDLEIPISAEKSITANYKFDTSGDSYEYYVPIGELDKRSQRKLALDALRSKPVKGITERITREGNLIITGSRSGLKNLSDDEIKLAFEDDVRRFSTFHERLAGDTTTNAPPPEGKKKKKRKGN